MLRAMLAYQRGTQALEDMRTRYDSALTALVRDSLAVTSEALEETRRTPPHYES
jgi:hypothetical protein